jgi:hypothetical protein
MKMVKQLRYTTVNKENSMSLKQTGSQTEAILSHKT